MLKKFLAIFALAGCLFSLDSLNVSLVCHYNSSGTCYEADIEGDYAYVADGESGFSTVNIADLSSPFYMDSVTTSDRCLGVQVESGLAYITARWGFFRIIDVSDPSDLRTVYVHTLPQRPVGILVRDGVAYIGCTTAGLVTVDVSDTSAIVELDSYDTPDKSTDIHIDYNEVTGRNYAYVADRSTGLMIFDITDPSSITHVNTYDTPGLTFGVSVVGDASDDSKICGLADDDTDLLLLNVSDPMSITEEATIDVDGSWSFCIELKKSEPLDAVYAFAGFHNGLRVFDITDPSTPNEVGYYLYDTRARNINIRDSLAIVGGWENGFYILNVKNFTMGIDDKNEITPDDYSLSAYPNPFNSSLKIDTKNVDFIEIIDISGKIEYSSTTNSNSIIWDANNCNTGIYMVKGYSNKKLVATRKVVYLK